MTWCEDCNLFVSMFAMIIYVSIMLNIIAIALIVDLIRKLKSKKEKMKAREINKCFK